MRLMSILKTSVALISLLIGSFAAAAGSYLHEGPLLLQNITIIDGKGHAPYPSRDVLIVDGRIQKISSTGMIGDLPENTRTVDGEGLTALPGLMDLHVHIGDPSFDMTRFEGPDPEGIQRTLNAHVYAGVTTVLDMGNSHDRIVALRDAVDAGEIIGPNIVPTGQTVGRLEKVRGTGNMTSDEVKGEIKEILDTRENAGIELVKLYGGVTPWGARHVSTAAHERGMRTVADFWCTNLSRTVFETARLSGYAHGGCRKLTQTEAEWMAENDKFAILTLAAFDIMGGYRAYADYNGPKAYGKTPLIVGPMGKDTVAAYYKTFTQMREVFHEGHDSFFQSQLFGDLSHLLPDNQYNAKLLHDAGVIIGTGTDANFPPGTFPGDATHHELRLHAEAGIAPVDVIKMATWYSAQIVERGHDLGSIERGKIADILIVSGDIANDITNSRNIEYVIKGGKLVDRKSLEAK